MATYTGITRPVVESDLNYRVNLFLVALSRINRLNDNPYVRKYRESIPAVNGFRPQDFNRDLLLAEAVHRGNRPRLDYIQVATGTYNSIRTRKDRDALARSIAEMFRVMDLMYVACEHGLYPIRKQLRGTMPVHDDEGNVLTGQAALEKRGDLYDKWHKRLGWNAEVDGVSLDDRIYNFMRECVDEQTALLSDDLQTAQQQLVERMDDAMAARCRYLFDGADHPSNENQQAAVYAISKHKQQLVRKLRTVTTVDAAKTAHASAVASVNSELVPKSPVWTVDGDPPSGHPSNPNHHESTYTRGTGKNKWKVSLHAHTPARSNAASLKEGEILLDEFSDPNFEVTNVTTRAADGDLSLNVQHKGAGHPPAGNYALHLTGRNRNGPTTFELAVTVP